MKKNEPPYTEEKIDYLREIMNIGSGNTAAALSQLLNCEVDVKLPNIRILPVNRVSSIFKDPSLPVLCVKMCLIGDVRGAIFFVVPDEQKKNLMKLARELLPHGREKRYVVDTSMLEELGNIVVGVFLSAIHDFTKLNIYHTIPVLAIGMIQSLLDESIVSASSSSEVFVIENEFSIDEGNVRTAIFIIPFVESIQAFFDSIKEACRSLGIE